MVETMYYVQRCTDHDSFTYPFFFENARDAQHYVESVSKKYEKQPVEYDWFSTPEAANRDFGAHYIYGTADGESNRVYWCVFPAVRWQGDK